MSSFACSPLRRLAPLAVALIACAVATPSRAAEPDERPHLAIAARVGATNLLWGGASVGLQAGVRFPNGLEVGALGDWGGLHDANIGDEQCDLRPPNPACQLRYSDALGYVAVRGRLAGPVDVHLELLGGAAFRSYLIGESRIDAALGVGAGLDLRAGGFLFGPSATLLVHPSGGGALLTTLRIGWDAKL